MSSTRNRIAVVLPYFGRLPSTWALTLSSMGENRGIDWLIFTDQQTESQSPNIQVIRTTLPVLRDRFSKELGFSVALHTPYKLCDFKPAYGDLFRAELVGYDYWGYCDADVVFGNVESNVAGALPAADFKVFKRGHLSLFPNTDLGRGAYRREVDGLDGFRAVFSDSTSRAFDEVGGMYQRYRRLGLSVFEDEALFDIAPDRYRLRANSGLNNERFYLMKGGIMSAHDFSGAQLRTGRYIHLQKRRYAELPTGWDTAPVLGFAPDRVVIAQTPEQACKAILARERSISSWCRWQGRYLARRLKGLRERIAG